jgi:competence protein ComEC
VLVPYLARRNLTGASLLVTHGHRDHYGGALALLRSQRIGDLYLGAVEKGRKWTAPLLAAARDADVRTHWLARGDSLQLGGWILRCLWPGPGAASLSTNNRSLVVRGGPGFAPMLWTGDLEHAAEARLLACEDSLRSEILKVAHHGSRTGTSEALLTRLGGSVALISCGVGNRYHHPHAPTLAALRAHGWRVLRTDQQGAVGVLWGRRSVRIRSVGAVP